MEPKQAELETTAGLSCNIVANEVSTNLQGLWNWGGFSVLSQNVAGHQVSINQLLQGGMEGDFSQEKSSWKDPPVSYQGFQCLEKECVL